MTDKKKFCEKHMEGMSLKPLLRLLQLIQTILADQN